MHELGCMKKGCPKKQCLVCKSFSKIELYGVYYRKSDSRRIQRYRCKNCNKTFSNATDKPEFGQNKRRVNNQIHMWLASKVSQRRMALNLGVARKTIERKVCFLGYKYEKKNRSFVKSRKLVRIVVFDELQTIEHTKCKPVSVPILVNAENRQILGFEVAKMPATGKLAKISVNKYGKREDQRRESIEKLFESVKNLIAANAIIISDKHPYYPKLIKKHFPNAIHSTFKGERSSTTGQGELKKTKFDPLFYINHAMAMSRDNIGLFVRKTWGVAKTTEGIRNVYSNYMYYHNTKLV